MIRRLLILFAIMTGVVVAQSNTPAPTPTVQRFVVSVSAGGYNNQKGTELLTIAGLSVQLTPNFSGGYNHIWNPSNSTDPTYKLGVGNYTRQLAEICSLCRKHFVFDTTQILTTFHGGIGTVSYKGASKLAGSLGGFLNIPLNDHTSFQLLGYQRLFGVGSPVLNRNQINSGLYLTF